MRHRVDRPEIVVGELDGPTALGFSGGVISAFLQAEGVHPEYVPVARHCPVPCADGAGHRVAHEVGLARPEQGEVLQPHREQIVRVVDQDLVPDADRARRVSLAPGGERGDVSALAERGARRQPLGLRQRGIDLAVKRVRAEQHEEITGQAVREAEARVRRDHLLQRRHRGLAVLEVFHHGAVEQPRRVGVLRGQDKPARIIVHGHTLSYLGDKNTSTPRRRQINRIGIPR